MECPVPISAFTIYCFFKLQKQFCEAASSVSFLQIKTLRHRSSLAKNTQVRGSKTGIWIQPSLVSAFVILTTISMPEDVTLLLSASGEPCHPKSRVCDCLYGTFPGSRTHRSTCFFFWFLCHPVYKSRSCYYQDQDQVSRAQLLVGLRDSFRVFPLGGLPVQALRLLSKWPS